MVNLVSVLRAQVIEQNRVTALQDCFATWDGGLDAEVILQGVHDRLAAMGKPSEGLRFERVSLTEIELVDKGSAYPALRFSVYQHFSAASVSSQWVAYGDKWLVFGGLRAELFHTAELEKAGVWLMENFHH